MPAAGASCPSSCSCSRCSPSACSRCAASMRSRRASGTCSSSSSSAPSSLSRPLHLLLDARTPLATAARPAAHPAAPPAAHLSAAHPAVHPLPLPAARDLGGHAVLGCLRLRCVPGARPAPRLTDRAACLNICGRVCLDYVRRMADDEWCVCALPESRSASPVQRLRIRGCAWRVPGLKRCVSRGYPQSVSCLGL